jgi:hypothetical protein
MEQNQSEGNDSQSLTHYLRHQGQAFGINPQQRESTYVLRRLLDRFFSGTAYGLQLKGGMAMKFRTEDARYTTDLDLSIEGLPLSDALEMLISGMKSDLDDGLRFDVANIGERSTTFNQPNRSARQLAVSYQRGGTSVPNLIKIDLVKEQRLLQPEQASPQLLLPQQGLPVSEIDLFALPHQIAQKVCGCLEQHNGLPSSRTKDLLDLAYIAVNFQVSRNELVMALEFEFEQRGLNIPKTFSPAKSLLTKYEQEKRRIDSKALPKDATAAVAMVSGFLALDLLEQRAGKWLPAQQTWDAN